jgi:hypothetical protein
VTPVFVLHGIANRTPDSLQKRVALLRERTANDDIHAVYWGHLGASDRYLADVVPGPVVRDLGVDPAADPALVAAVVGGAPALDPATALAIVADAARAVDGAAGAVAAAAWRESDLPWLRQVGDPDVLHEIGTAVGRAVAGSDVDGGRYPVRDGSSRRVAEAVLRGFDRVTRSSLTTAAERVNRWMRATKGPVLARNLGDVVLYHSDRERIQDAVRAAVAAVDPALGTGPGRPVHLVGHSLGGAIALDLATHPDRPLWTSSVVTFGCQWPLFHLWHPRPGLATYTGEPVRLPPSVGCWRNLWEPLDPLAFVAAAVFRGHDAASHGDPGPHDIRVTRPAADGFATHSTYWESPELVRQLRIAWGLHRVGY